jgi:hypothetical protein
MGYPADEDWYDTLLEAHAGVNQTAIDVPLGDQLAAQANATVDPALASALSQRAAQAYVNAVAGIVLDQPDDVYHVSQRVVGSAENEAGLIPNAAQLGMYVTQGT